MPTAQDTTTYLIEVMPGETTQDFLSRDVDLLVSKIKENLRLSGLKAKSSTVNRNRATPYRVPSSRTSWADSNGCDLCNAQNRTGHRHRHHQRHHLHHNCSDNDREDDPYELLQELLRGGGLIKEAVKRLKANFVEYKCSMDNKLQEDEDDDEDDDDDDDDDDEEDDEDVLEDGMVMNGAKERSMVYRRKPYFYDSEDEPLVYESFEL
ncbi:transcriptional regulator ADR1-like [Polistes fuscatus]|uniref:transcriptional regulator ADR1-like n=1 Tax=Polistes fuscatus TaxID=30207 RepID=UPI001CA9F1B6|nr:transcriptional regulator ADR1-like [Polistes fuscatus]